MKKIFALLMSFAMLSIMAFSVFAESYPVNSDTLTLHAPGGAGVSIGSDGKTVILDNPSGVGAGKSTKWINAELMVDDDLKDGFSIKITDIKWDRENNNAVAIVYGNTEHMNCDDVKETDAAKGKGLSNFTLIVRNDGSVTLFGNGFNSNHLFGKWAAISANKALGTLLTEFTYKLVPNADKTLYTFYLNDEIIYEYDIAEAEATVEYDAVSGQIDQKKNKFKHSYSIFSNPDTPCHFGFMVLNGEGDKDTGWSSEAIGSLSYTVDEVNSEGKAEAVSPNNTTDTEKTVDSASVTTADNSGNSTDAVTTEKVTSETADNLTDSEITDENGNNAVVIAIVIAAIAVVGVVVFVIIKNKKK